MTILEENLHEDIRKLDIAIEGLETQVKETSDKDELLSIHANITAKQNLVTAKTELLTTLIKSQGNFSSHISTALFPIFSMLSIARSLSTSPLHPFLFCDCSRCEMIDNAFVLFLLMVSVHFLSPVIIPLPLFIQSLIKRWCHSSGLRSIKVCATKKNYWCAFPVVKDFINQYQCCF